ncbi:MAG: hypothetical protein ACTSU2_04000 [Promethearchaeota archaeon]
MQNIYKIGQRVKLELEEGRYIIGKIVDRTLGIRDPSKIKYKIKFGICEDGDLCYDWYYPHEFKVLSKNIDIDLFAST